MESPSIYERPFSKNKKKTTNLNDFIMLWSPFAIVLGSPLAYGSDVGITLSAFWDHFGVTSAR